MFVANKLVVVVVDFCGSCCSDGGEFCDGFGGCCSDVVIVM
jgi:hypothetical protein